ncbi:hypothetical protein [Kitasatospora sp. NPDC017646]
MADPDLSLEFNPAELDGCGQSAQHMGAPDPFNPNFVAGPVAPRSAKAAE